MVLNLHLLRIFAAVAEAGSFSRAAQRLHISQPAVSKGVRELEHQLGMVLIERVRPKAEGGLPLTEGGAALLTHARSIFALERVALEDVRARVGARRGTLTIGASTTIAGHLLPPYLATFSLRHPQVQLKLVVGNTRWIGEQLGECRIDLALVDGPVDDERLAVTRWKDEPMVIVTQPTSDLASRRAKAETLSAERWILREPGTGTRRATDALCQANGIETTAWMELASNAAIARTVASGVGISMLPRCVVAELLALGTLKQVHFRGAQPLLRPLFLLSLKARPLTPAASRMVDLLTG